jgi:hypothetical protein
VFLILAVSLVDEFTVQVLAIDVDDGPDLGSSVI